VILFSVPPQLLVSFPLAPPRNARGRCRPALTAPSSWMQTVSGSRDATPEEIGGAMTAAR
jgi:hypothetical protein